MPCLHTTMIRKFRREINNDDAAKNSEIKLTWYFSQFFSNGYLEMGEMAKFRRIHRSFVLLIFALVVLFVVL